MQPVKRAGFYLLAAALTTIATSWLFARAYMHSPIALTESAVYEVSAGSSLSRVAAELGELGALERPQVFSIWGRISGAAEQIKTGEYALEPGISPAGILQLLVEGRVKLYPITLLEGWTLRDIRVAFDANPAIRVTLGPAADSYATVLDDTVSGISNPEGWFFPETYYVAKGATDADVLRQANQLMSTKLSKAWDSRAADLPLNSPYELLTLASIVERETAVDDERRQVAGVFVRRLLKGMRLQTDPTVIYGLGDSYDGNLTRRHLLTDNPYNTYKRSGLPPTPIGMPGEASLQAAGHPDDSDALYFVATGEGDGRHIFSATLDDHNAAVAAYIAQLRRNNRARKDNGPQ
jgi:UPF0755 protein